MIQLRDTESGALLGAITEQQLEFLEGQLEEEFQGDQDYWFDTASLDVLEEQGADPDLMAVLRSALGDREEMEIRWERV
jgi:hypothetical protein